MSLNFARSVRPAMQFLGPVAVGLLASTILWALLPAGSTQAAGATNGRTAVAAGGASGREQPASQEFGARSASPASNEVLVSQTPWVTAGQPGFTLQIGIGPQAAAAGRLQLSVAVYRRLGTRTAFDQAVGGLPGAVLDRLAPIPVGPGDLRPSVGFVVTTGTASAPNSIGLDCAAGQCSGVYPVTVALEQSSGAVLGRIDTFLTYLSSPSSNPLRFALVLSFGAPIRIHPGGAGSGGAIDRPARGAVTNLVTSAKVLAARSQVPISLLADPATIQGLQGSRRSDVRQALATLSSLSKSSDAIDFLPAPFVPVDLSPLAAEGLSGEITYQVKVGEAALIKDGFRTNSTNFTWVSESGGVGPSLEAGLADAGARRVVLPDSAVSEDPRNSSITQPFAIGSGRSPMVTAAVADSGLGGHYPAADGSLSRDPALAAEQLLADLAFIQSERPGAAQARGVVSVTPLASTLSPTFLETVLAGLEGNPAVRAVTLDQFFEQVPAGANGQPAIRNLVAGSTRAGFSASAATSISRARQRNDAFHSAVVGSPAVLEKLDDLLLAAESNEVGPTRRSAAVGAYERALGAQLSLVQLSSDRRVTLTSRTGLIPITFTSAAPYALRGNVVLSSGKFAFPQGSTRSGFAIDRTTNPLPMEVQARTSGDLPLLVTLTAPQTDPGALPLVIAKGELTVRSTATSVVGVVLTLIAVAVLLGWWLRTWRRGPKGRLAKGERHP